jgi:hypothetical protein
MDEKYTLVYLANGALEAQTIKIFLESQGLHPLIIQESAGLTYGLTVGPLGTAQIMIPNDEEETAKTLLAEMDNGDFENSEDDNLNPDDEENIDQ